MVAIDSYSVNNCNCGVPVGGGELGVYLLHHHDEPFQNLYLTREYAMENLSYLQRYSGDDIFQEAVEINHAVRLGRVAQNNDHQLL